MTPEQLRAAHGDRAACPEHVWRHGGTITDADECIRCGGRYLHTISEGCRDAGKVKVMSDTMRAKTIGTEYTATTDEVRAAFGRITHAEHDRTWDSGVAEFDRWLAEHDRQVAAETLTDMADEWQAIEPIDSIGRFWRDIFAGKLRASIEQTEAK